jgi:hypothetical protein
MRVLLWDLPQWLNDILREAIRSEAQFDLVEWSTTVPDILDVLARTEVDVLVTHDSAHGIADRSAEILFLHPRLRMVSLGGGPGGTAQLALSLAQRQYGDVSLPTLVRIIAGDQTTRTIAAVVRHGGGQD